MDDSPLMILLLAAVAGYVLKLWIDDYRAFCRGLPNPRALPGAAPVHGWIVALSIIGSVLLVGLETGGEYALGITGEQSTVPALFLVAMVAAGIGEELIFRGFLVVRNRGAWTLAASVVAASIVFALLHGHLISPAGDADAEAAGQVTAAFYSLHLDTGPAALWWTFILFLNSLWWYAMRFVPANVQRSLLPCFAGHIASNLAVFAIKAAQGFVSW